MAAANRRVVVHPSVPVRWWLYHLANGAEALRFYHQQLLPGVTGLVAPEGLRFELLRQIAADLAGEGVVPATILGIFDDCTWALSRMLEAGTLRLVSQDTVARAALLLATEHRIDLFDAQCAVLAEGSGLPLLIADDQFFRAAATLATARPRLQLIWLPDYLRA